MRRVVFIFLFIILAVVSAPAQAVFAYPETTADEIVIQHIGFTLSYNPKTMMPNWVAYQLHATDLEGDAVRAGRFSPDPSPQLNGYTLAEHWNYTNSGWVRGHMVPAGDLKYSQEAMNCSFYTTNICPMDMTFNNGIWKRLEEKIRKLAIQFGYVFIITGPVVGDNTHGNVGESGIVVPDAFFKAIIVPCNASFKAIGFYMPNEPAPKGSRLKDFAVPVKELETLIDRTLFIHLSHDIAFDVKSQLPLKELGLY